jgi:hypothetical protein
MLNIKHFKQQEKKDNNNLKSYKLAVKDQSGIRRGEVIIILKTFPNLANIFH